MLWWVVLVVGDVGTIGYILWGERGSEAEIFTFVWATIEDEPF